MQLADVDGLSLLRSRNVPHALCTKVIWFPPTLSNRGPSKDRVRARNSMEDAAEFHSGAVQHLERSKIKYC